VGIIVGFSEGFLLIGDVVELEESFANPLYSNVGDPVPFGFIDGDSVDIVVEEKVGY